MKEWSGLTGRDRGGRAEGGGCGADGLQQIADLLLEPGEGGAGHCRGLQVRIVAHRKK